MRDVEQQITDEWPDLTVCTTELNGIERSMQALAEVITDEEEWAAFYRRISAARDTLKGIDQTEESTLIGKAA